MQKFASERKVALTERKMGKQLPSREPCMCPLGRELQGLDKNSAAWIFLLGLGSVICILHQTSGPWTGSFGQSAVV